MDDARSFATSARLPVATAVLATGIFIADTVTRVDIAFAVLYVAVVLLAARFCRPTGVVLVAAGCVTLTIVSYFITRSSGPTDEGIFNTLIGIGAVALITPLALKDQSREFVLRQARDHLQVAVEKRTQQALLLDQTHDSIFLCDMNGLITYWNRGAQELYGWSAEEAVGKVMKDLLKAVFPAPLDEIEAELMRTGRWEGEVVHTKKDGSQVAMASRWSLRRDEAGAPVAILETNNDITDRKRAEEAVRHSEKELRDLLATMPTIAFSARPDGFNEFQSRRWLEYSGLSAETSAGHGWTAAVHPDDLNRYVGTWQASLASGEPFEDEVRYRNADGEYRWFLIRAVPLRDRLGTIVKWYGTGVDIEDRKRAEALLAGEKRILEMVAKGDSLAEILDSLCRLVEEQVRGTLASILLLDGDRLRHGGAPSLPKAYTDAIDGLAIGPSAGSCGTAAYRGERVMVEDIATDPLWASFRDLALPHGLRACWSTPVVSSQGKVIAIFAMYDRQPRSPGLRDQEVVEQINHLAGVAIERKLAQDALRRSEAYLAEAQRLTHTGTWGWNVRSGDLFWSQECFRIFEWDAGKMKPTYSRFLAKVHPEDRPYVAQQGRMESTQREWVDSELDFRIVLAAGKIKHLHTIAHPVMDESGRIIEVVGTVMDVTERKRAEQERERVRQLEADLAHINRVSMMGELAASLAHEIKQPITAAATNARTSLRWLRRDPPDMQEAGEAVSRVVDDVNRAADIINRMRSLYTKGVEQRELVDVNAVIEEMIVLLRHEASRYAIPIRSDLAKDLPKVMIDRVQVQQVLMNLMLNGIEAMKEKAGELMVKSECSVNGQLLLISVTDTGVGLPAGMADQIFNAFFTTKPQGTGMGLAITRSIIEAHGGRLWARANSGRGATFQFTLPTFTESGCAA